MHTEHQSIESRAARHRHAPTGVSRFIGRVGALAFFLGIGTALVPCAVAAASETATSDTSASSSDTSSSAGNGAAASAAETAGADSTPQGGPSSVSGSDDAKAGDSPDADATETADDSDADADTDTDDTDDAETADVIDTGDEESTHSGHSGRPEVAISKDDESEAEPAPDITPAASRAATEPDADTDDHPAVASARINDSAAAANTAEPAGDEPGPAPAQSLLWAAADWARRQLEYLFFNNAPTIGYNPAQNTLSKYGAISGNLNGTDAEGDWISYLLSAAPTRGSVVINADGHFTYVPDDDFAQSGGMDTFTVRVSDQAGNPLHINLNTLLSQGLVAYNDAQITVSLEGSSISPPDQLQMEARAAQIAASPQLQSAKNLIRPVWLLLGFLKYLPAGGLDGDGLARLDRALDEFTYGVAMRVVNSDPTRPKILTYEIPPHNWGDFSVPGGRWAYDNPDSVYRTIPVNGTSAYVITGAFTGSRPTDLNFSVYTDINVTNTVDNIGLSDLVVNDDGTFTITVDATPADGRPNHLQLTPDALQVFVRDTLGDWSESPVTLSIVRVGGPDPAPPKTFDQLVSDARSLMFGSGIGLYALMLLPFIQPVNTLKQPTHTPGTLATQRQSSTLFNLADDQAMVVTVTLGDAGYFTTPITDEWTITPDYRDQQISLNSEQAVANPDGSYTLVISATDPGVANWVSTAGLDRGTLFVRWQLPDANSDAGAPTVSSQVVRLDELTSVLPGGTTYLTPTQRADQLALRAAGYDSRFTRFGW